MRLLVLSFYYEPDLSAGSFRTTALVQALQRRAPPGASIDVITTLPNRYRSFSQGAEPLERLDNVEIRRISLPTHHSDIWGQSRAFAAFARGARAAVRNRSYDVVYATSSRLMTAALGAWIAQRTDARLYLDLRDIFVETIGELLPGPLSALSTAAFSRIEAWTIGRADRINLVSPAFVDYFRERYGEHAYTTFTNGIDDEFLAAAPAVGDPAPPRAGKATILYAGNIGEGQGLHRVLPQLAAALRDRARFVVIGDGARREALRLALERAGTQNVELLPPMPRAELLRAYRTAHVLFLHLGTHAAFRRVLPSKVFEYAALGKPLLAGVAGYAADFIREEIDNAAVFSPGDSAAGVRAYDSLVIADRVRWVFTRKFGRSAIAASMADDVLALATAPAKPS